MATVNEATETLRAKAYSHPLRARILRLLGEGVRSPGDLAVELGKPLGVVSYHVRMLRDYGMVELVRTEPRRGALQHFYRATDASVSPLEGLLRLLRLAEEHAFTLMVADGVVEPAVDVVEGMAEWPDSVRLSDLEAVA
jgi:DNA-binding transcriptional ArsR family regulator